MQWLLVNRNSFLKVQIRSSGLPPSGNCLYLPLLRSQLSFFAFWQNELSSLSFASPQPEFKALKWKIWIFMSLRWRGSESRFSYTSKLKACTIALLCRGGWEGWLHALAWWWGWHPQNNSVRNAFVHTFWVDPAFQMKCLSALWVRRWQSSEPQASLCTTTGQGYLVYWDNFLSHTPFLSLTTPDPWSNVECRMTISSWTRRFKQESFVTRTKPWSLGELAYLHTLCLINCAPQMEHAKPPCLLHEILSNISLTETLWCNMCSGYATSTLVFQWAKYWMQFVENVGHSWATRLLSNDLWGFSRSWHLLASSARITLK